MQYSAILTAAVTLALFAESGLGAPLGQSKKPNLLQKGYKKAVEKVTPPIMCRIYMTTGGRSGSLVQEKYAKPGKQVTLTAPTDNSVTIKVPADCIHLTFVGKPNLGKHSVFGEVNTRKSPFLDD